MFTVNTPRAPLEIQSSARTQGGSLNWLYPFTDIRALNRIVRAINPLASLTGTYARIEQVVKESDDVHSLVLKPNRRWRGHLGGQHCLLEVEMDGVRQQRAFSVSSSPAQRDRVRISVKRGRQGGVSDWIAGRARVGDVVKLGVASGEFVLPSPLPARLAMLAAGSGITPLLAMLHQLADARWDGDIVLLQCHRNQNDLLFASEIAKLAQRLPGLRRIGHASEVSGRVGTETLLELIPDLEQRHLMMCGPTQLMTGIESFYSDRGWTDRLQREWFGRPPLAAADHPEGSRDLLCSQSNRRIAVAAGESLLEAAERAGLQPAFGCRAGICRTCLCRKTSGQVRNQLTGRLSEQPDEWIQLCITSAHTDIEVEL